MTKGLKVGLIVVASLLVTCFGGAYLLYRNFVAPAVEQGTAAYADGEMFAANSDQQGCVNEARARGTRDSSMTSAIAQGLFLRSCLEKSRPTPGFCDSIPAPSDSTRRGDMEAWVKERCPGAQSSAPGCVMLEVQLQSFCHPTKRG
jgi:hypothetical protein